MDEMTQKSTALSKKEFREFLNKVPEEILWQANFNSPKTIETYQLAIKKFVEMMGIKSHDEFREISHGHIIAYRNSLKESGMSPSTVNNRLSALSSLFNHLIDKQIVKINPVTGIKRLRAEYKNVKSKRLSKDQARALINEPDTEKLQGLRDRAIIATFLFTGCRVSECCNLTVGDLFEENGYFILDFKIKGGTRNRIAIKPELKELISDYLEASGHGDNVEMPLFLQSKSNSTLDVDRHLTRQTFAKLWKKYTERLGIVGSTPHSARTTFISRAIENGCEIEKVQKTVGHSQISTTQMYDKTEHHFKDSASFLVNY